MGMELHRVAPLLAREPALEGLDGARVGRLLPQDLPRVRAFFEGLHETAALRLDHPGPETTASRDGSRLLIRVGFGAKDDHGLIATWEAHTLRITHIDPHRARFRFMGRMLQERGFTWEPLASPIEAPLHTGSFGLVGQARLTSDQEGRLREALGGVASCLVFLTDWNQARKQLQTFVRKPVAEEMLDTLAREKLGHTGWLRAGGAALVHEAMQALDSEALHRGERLDRVLGESVAREDLLALMRAASPAARERPELRHLADEARRRLACRARPLDTVFDLLAEHAACGHELALSVVEGLLHDASEASCQDRLRRAKAWQRQTGPLLERARHRAERQARWRPVLTLLERQEEVADALDETLFLMSLPTEPARPAWPMPVRRSLDALAQNVLAAQQDQVRAIEVARHLDARPSRIDGEALLDRVWSILQAERTGDELLREARRQIVQTLHAHAPCLQLATELATTLEGATDRLLSAAFALRKMVFEPSGGSA